MNQPYQSSNPLKKVILFEDNTFVGIGNDGALFHSKQSKEGIEFIPFSLPYRYTDIKKIDENSFLAFGPQNAHIIDVDSNKISRYIFTDAQYKPIGYTLSNEHQQFSIITYDYVKTWSLKTPNTEQDYNELSDKQEDPQKLIVNGLLTQDLYTDDEIEDLFLQFLAGPPVDLSELDETILQLYSLDLTPDLNKLKELALTKLYLQKASEFAPLEQQAYEEGQDESALAHSQEEAVQFAHQHIVNANHEYSNGGTLDSVVLALNLSYFNVLSSTQYNEEDSVSIVNTILKAIKYYRDQIGHFKSPILASELISMTYFLEEPSQSLLSDLSDLGFDLLKMFPHSKESFHLLIDVAHSYGNIDLMTTNTSRNFIKKAESELQKFLAKNPENSDANMNYIYVYSAISDLYLKKYQSAVAVMEKSKEIESNDEVFTSLLFICYAYDNQLRKAIDLITEHEDYSKAYLKESVQEIMNIISGPPLDLPAPNNKQAFMNLLKSSSDVQMQY